jgi:hypothetical protein
MRSQKCQEQPQDHLSNSGCFGKKFRSYAQQGLPQTCEAHSTSRAISAMA